MAVKFMPPGFDPYARIIQVASDQIPGPFVMNTIQNRRQALARRLNIDTQELETVSQESDLGARFQHQPGGYYMVYSLDEEKQAFKTRVPDLPFMSQIRDDEGRVYNVYLSVEPVALA